MNTQALIRSSYLNTIPQRKLQELLLSIENSKDDLQTKNVKSIAINRYAESNIPVEYWALKMERDFKGDNRLLAKYNEYISDLKASYMNGTSICFSGPHGVGKSLNVTCILKKASQKGYSCHYSELSNIISVLISATNEEKLIAKRELSLVDFLVIDEIDSRFLPSDNASDLFARSLESVFRTRSQNKLPTLMCTNSPNIVEIFKGALKESLDSLMNGYLTIFPVFGKDFRKQK